MCWKMSLMFMVLPRLLGKHFSSSYNFSFVIQLVVKIFFRAVVAAVVVVNTIILVYAWKAFKETIAEEREAPNTEDDKKTD